MFNPNYGLFVLNSSNELYPNSKSHLLFPNNEDIKIYTFLGRLLGKAMYEGITVEPRFANFFLKKLVGKQHAL